MLIHGFWLVNARLLMAFGTVFYAIIVVNVYGFTFLFGSPVLMYRKSYCTTPGICVGVVSAFVVVVVVLLFYVHGKHLRSCRDGQLT